ncbi:MAG: hypothetical protein JEY94_17315 [Melioribacteraceae bacterium]|nr:hypothetical protein [Melioribacteraceae bacterium]
MKNTVAGLILIILLSSNFNYGQNENLKTLTILPFYSNGIDDISLESSETIFRQELSKLDSFNISSRKLIYNVLGEDICTEFDCALSAGEKLESDNVVYFNFLSLGKKIIVQFTLIDINKKSIILDESINVSSIEDFDTVMKRIALSVATKKTIEETAQVGLITKNESNKSFLRGSRKYYGFSFGYFKPVSGFDDMEKSFNLEFETGAELETVAYGLKMFVRKGFGASVFMSYLFSNKDFCPFVGGGIGYHLISDEAHYERRYVEYDYGYEHGSYYYDEHPEDKGDGVELHLHTGLRLFHTYNFRIKIGFEYSYTLNEFNDHAFAFTIGFLK